MTSISQIPSFQHMTSIVLIASFQTQEQVYFRKSSLLPVSHSQNEPLTLDYCAESAVLYATSRITPCTWAARLHNTVQYAQTETPTSQWNKKWTVATTACKLHLVQLHCSFFHFSLDHMEKMHQKRKLTVKTRQLTVPADKSSLSCFPVGENLPTSPKSDCVCEYGKMAVNFLIYAQLNDQWWYIPPTTCFITGWEPHSTW